ncbi:MAG: delta 9 acyl-lipid desaturase, partial [Cyanobacteriota bacterium]
MTVATSEKIPPAWGTIIYLAIIHFLALFAIFPRNFSWGALGIAFILYVITAGVGITLGFHRLVSHRSYQVPRLLEYCLIFCGTLAGQGGPLDWIGL